MKNNPQKNSFKKDVLICKDHTVSGKEFELHYNPKMELFETFPKPNMEELPYYYKSEKYISHTDSTSGVFDKIYQWVKSFMLKKKLAWIENEEKQKGRILDIGAGTGDFLQQAKLQDWEADGVEPNFQARNLASKKGLDFHENTMKLPSHSFDVISLWHVLEHVPDLDFQIQELQRLLKPDGLLIIAVPNFKSWDAQKYKEHWAGYDVPRHFWHFSQNSIRLLFQKQNFEITNTKGLFFDSFYVSLLSEKYKNSSGNILRGFWNGFLSNVHAKSTNEYSSMVYFLRKV